ncbi:MAG: DNA polymerase Y family protein [Paracoccaceae bacterium]|nr:DNA polymerase Y family protein [Paracoccaceae bacterium]
MPNRRIVSIWFPRFGAERLLRTYRQTIDHPFAVVEDLGQMQVLSSLSVCASQEGLQIGQPLRDAQAMCPSLMTRLRNKQAEELFLCVLARWVGKFSPWVAVEKPDSLLLDITGCTHLFGGEEAFLHEVQSDVYDLGLTIYTGLADTPGAAWALARYAGQATQSHRSGDAIDQEARATRSRAAKRRHWERGGSAPQRSNLHQKIQNITPPGKTHSASQPLPVAALRIDQTLVDGLNRLGLRRIGDLSSQPRTSLARRFGKGLVEQLDKALGSLPEPISPLQQIPHFGVRLSLPEPIGLIGDIIGAIDRLLPRLCIHLRSQSQGARRVRLQCFHTDDTVTNVEVGLARASDSPDRIRPLLLMKLDDIKAGFGIDVLRLEATGTEALHQSGPKEQLALQSDLQKTPSPTEGLEDLIGKLGGRIGLENITRYHPANSHIPEKTFQTLAAAWSEAAANWPEASQRRPVLLWRPEPVKAPEIRLLPREFQWRGRKLRTRTAQGPERIAPEWWLDDSNWRSGVRDYWQVTCEEGDLLWLFYAHGATMSAGWFCQGSFT